MLLAVLAGALLAWWGYHGRLSEPLARRAAFARFAGSAIVVLLALDPGFVGRALAGRALVLVDHSLSMSAAGGRRAEADSLAATLGDTLPFGELAPGLPGGTSRLAEVIGTSAAGGRALVIVTDGEIGDSADIAPDLLLGATVHALPRPAIPDIALTAARAPERLSAGDTLRVDIEARRTLDAPDSAGVQVRDSSGVLLQGMLRFGGADRARLSLRGALPARVRGERWIEVALTGRDGEPGDDLRWLRLVVTPTPGIVVLAATPDWDGRALYRALRDLAAAPVSGFVMLQAGRWFRMDDLRPVTAAEVLAAARAADLLAVRGDPAPYRTMGRARLLWPEGTDEGDWFVSPGGASPLSGVFLGAGSDSLPSLPAIRAVDRGTGSSWVGVTARRSRRGAEIPVVAGQSGPAGRTVTFGVDGLSRWASRGSASEQVWRSLVAGAANWLLAAPEGDSVLARPLVAVTQRGRAVRFRWLGAGAPATLAITLDGPSGERGDSLRFDGAGEAALFLETGRYRYHLGRGGSGAFAVEPYSDEFVPARVTLATHAASAVPTAPRRSWRELGWLFAAAVLAFGAEWVIRRRMGAR